MHDCNLDVYFIYIERELNPQTEIAKWLIDCRRERRLWIYILHVLVEIRRFIAYSNIKSV